jgi:DNA-binding NtrC family response regulator
MARRSATSARAATGLGESFACVFLITVRRQIRLFSRGCERETGWSAAEMLEHRADYLTEADAQSAAAVAAAIAPPPEVWQGQSLAAAIDLPHREEEPRPRLVQFFPLVDEAGAVTSVLGVITPVPAPGSPHAPSVVQTLHAELAALRHELRQRFGERTLVARGPAMHRVLTQIKVAQASAAPVLLQGEPGSGREHIARVIHYGGAHGRRSFVPFDCSQVDSLELKRSLRHLAEERTGGDSPLSPGTLYFTNLDAAPADVGERVAEFVSGDLTSLPRIIASTSTPLEPLVDEQRFPRELYYRLTSLVIDVPPLRERLDDLGPLAQLFLEELNRDADQQVSGFSDDVQQQFRRYHWPGNLDELRAVVVEARHAATGPLILPDHLPFRFRTGVDAQKIAPRQRAQPLPLDALLEQVEREQLELALEETRGNISQAAELLEIPRARFYRRMQQLGLSDDREPTEETGT